MKPAAFRTTEVVALGSASAPFRSGMDDYLRRLVLGIGYPRDTAHRYMMVAHLFDDTMRMLDALAPVTTWDAIIGVPYSSNRPGVAERWRAASAPPSTFRPTWRSWSGCWSSSSPARFPCAAATASG